MYLAIDEGRPYNGIDTYESAVGKKILNYMHTYGKKIIVINVILIKY